MNPILTQTAPDGNGDDLDNEPDNDTGWSMNRPTKTVTPLASMTTSKTTIMRWAATSRGRVNSLTRSLLNTKQPIV